MSLNDILNKLANVEKLVDVPWSRNATLCLLIVFTVLASFFPMVVTFLSFVAITFSLYLLIKIGDGRHNFPSGMLVFSFFPFLIGGWINWNDYSSHIEELEIQNYYQKTIEQIEKGSIIEAMEQINRKRFINHLYYIT